MFFHLGFSQSQIEYKRIRSHITILTLNPNSTFTEVHNNFSCGTCRQFLKDTIFKGLWFIKQDTLNLNYGDNKDFVQLENKFLIDDSHKRLVSLYKAEPYNNYYKTRVCIENQELCDEINPIDLIQQFNVLSIETSFKELNILIEEIEFWSEINGQNAHLGKFLIEDIRSPYYSYFETAFLMGKLEYLIMNREKIDYSKQIKNGLLFAMKCYNKNTGSTKKIELFEKINELNNTDKLESWINLKFIEEEH